MWIHSLPNVTETGGPSYSREYRRIPSLTSSAQRLIEIRDQVIYVFYAHA